MADRMLIEAYCELKDKMVVKAPAPANSGKTTGKKLLSLGASALLLNISISKIISIAITKIISEPAIANEAISTPNNDKTHRLRRKTQRTSPEQELRFWLS